jgi:hypothetical protein
MVILVQASSQKPSQELKIDSARLKRSTNENKPFMFRQPGMLPF